MGCGPRNVILVSIVGVFLAIICRVKFLHLSASTLLNFDPESCPFCFGRSICSEVQHANIRLNLVDLVVGHVNHKYVYVGSFKSYSVVIKGLATEAESKALKVTVHSLANGSDVRHIDWFSECLHLLNSSFTDASYKLRVCPGSENVDDLLSSFIATFQDTESETDVYANLWTNLFLNPEPVLLTILNNDEGWPVAKYFGSCGKFAIMEHCGKPIQYYADYPWLFRVHIFAELLRMALHFTFSSDKFAVYFRDMSRTNIVIDDLLKTRVVDLEHTILVDKHAHERSMFFENPRSQAYVRKLKFRSSVDRPKFWNSTHRSTHFECNDCLTYSPSEICSHHISDHNVYAVCKEFAYDFSSNDLGLLHSPPQQRFSPAIADKLRYLTSECVNPVGNHTRFEVAQDFVDFLEELKRTENFNSFDYIGM